MAKLPASSGPQAIGLRLRVERGHRAGHPDCGDDLAVEVEDRRTHAYEADARFLGLERDTRQAHLLELTGPDPGAVIVRGRAPSDLSIPAPFPPLSHL